MREKRARQRQRAAAEQAAAEQAAADARADGDFRSRSRIDRELVEQLRSMSIGGEMSSGYSKDMSGTAGGNKTVDYKEEGDKKYQGYEEEGTAGDKKYQGYEEEGTAGDKKYHDLKESIVARGRDKRTVDYKEGTARDKKTVDYKEEEGTAIDKKTDDYKDEGAASDKQNDDWKEGTDGAGKTREFFFGGMKLVLHQEDGEGDDTGLDASANMWLQAWRRTKAEYGIVDDSDDPDQYEHPLIGRPQPSTPRDTKRGWLPGEQAPPRTPSPHF
jgi:hypothetical protein